ncbi:transcriptional regulator [Nitratireductor indicus C115]|uniref:Transcriptional regulator n=1 Tax=Nitratireductor indicus C115 TaxID=1231190 RepID=K2P9F1_9HYPH|nr:IclR family transcriptional regulator [Nitratireductor indicus]EKF43816.1 transcriptional regulator [Nitratireductor indicus C115]SFQ16310.1 transcriptional regulator, IclR family [Nitratireductor indicus]
MSDKDRQFVEALARGLAVLESLSRAQQPLTNGDLAKMTGLAPSTVSRLTHTLTMMGYVRLSRSNRAYELTPKNLTLGYPVLAGMPLLEQARPHLEQLSRTTGETAALAIRDKLHITFVAVIEGANLVAVRLATGGRLRIPVSAAGIALVAALPDAERRLLATRVRAEMTRTGQNPEAFTEAVAECRRDGVAIVRNLWNPGIGGVSVPVYNQGEYAALTIPVATGSIPEQTMRTTLADALKEVAEILGPALPV